MLKSRQTFTTQNFFISTNWNQHQKCSKTKQNSYRSIWLETSNSVLLEENEESFPIPGAKLTK